MGEGGERMEACDVGRGADERGVAGRGKGGGGRGGEGAAGGGVDQ